MARRRPAREIAYRIFRDLLALAAPPETRMSGPPIPGPGPSAAALRRLPICRGASKAGRRSTEGTRRRDAGHLESLERSVVAIALARRQAPLLRNDHSSASDIRQRVARAPTAATPGAHHHSAFCPGVNTHSECRLGLSRARASSGSYGRSPPGQDPDDAMFAPCLLGCRGTARYQPVLGDSGT